MFHYQIYCFLFWSLTILFLFLKNKTLQLLGLDILMKLACNTSLRNSLKYFHLTIRDGVAFIGGWSFLKTVSSGVSGSKVFSCLEAKPVADLEAADDSCRQCHRALLSPRSLWERPLELGRNYLIEGREKETQSHLQ